MMIRLALRRFPFSSIWCRASNRLSVQFYSSNCFVAVVWVFKQNFPRRIYNIGELIAKRANGKHGLKHGTNNTYRRTHCRNEKLQDTANNEVNKRNYWICSCNSCLNCRIAFLARNIYSYRGFCAIYGTSIRFNRLK